MKITHLDESVILKLKTEYQSIDETFVQDIHKMLIEQFTAGIPNLYAFVQNSQWEDLRKAAHRLKSSAGHLGCFYLMNQLQSLETRVVSKQLPITAQDISLIQEGFDLVKPLLDKVVFS